MSPESSLPETEKPREPRASLSSALRIGAMLHVLARRWMAVSYPSRLRFHFSSYSVLFFSAIVAMSAAKQVIGIATNISSSSSRLPSPYPARRIRQACHLDFSNFQFPFFLPILFSSLLTSSFASWFSVRIMT